MALSQAVHTVEAMFLGLRTVIYPVADLAAATAWYTEVLGFGPYFEEPFYVGFEVGGYELGLLPNGPTGIRTYWGVKDAEAAVAELVSKGATIADPVTEVGEGIKTGAVTDPQGNVVGIIENPHFQL